MAQSINSDIPPGQRKHKHIPVHLLASCYAPVCCCIKTPKKKATNIKHPKRPDENPLVPFVPIISNLVTLKLDSQSQKLKLFKRHEL